MPIDFPTLPATGQTYSYGINRWIYNGVAWDKLDNHPGISAGNQISVGYQESLSGASFSINVVEGHGSDLDADLLDGVSGERFIENLETGLLYGGLLSINSGNTATFDVTAGLAVFTTLNATTTSAPAPTVSYTQWTAKTGVTLAGLTSSDISFVSINSSGQFLQSNTPFTNTQYETQVPIGALIHPSRTYISFAQSYPHVAYDQASQSDTFIRSFGPLKISGHDISGYGATLQLSRASGVAYALGRNYANDPNSPNIVSDTNANPAAVIYRQYRGVTAGTWNTVVNTAVDPHYYDDGSGTLASIPGGRYSIQRVFYFPNSPTVLLIYYGRATYNSIDTAKSALLFEQFSESQDTAESAIFCGYLIIKSGITNFSATGDYSIIQGGLFRSTVNVGGGGVAVANLDDLNDVTITSVANNQALVYDSSTGQWVNKSFSSLPVVTSFNGSTGAVTGVGSFNGSTGTIVGVNSVRGLTGTVGITNGSGIGLSVSGQTMTFSNTGVLSIDGGTGAITNVAKTNVNNNFSTSQSVNGAIVASDPVFTVTINPTKITFYEDNLGFSTDLYAGQYLNQSIYLPGYSTILAGLSGDPQTFTGTNIFNSIAYFNGGISAAGATFSSLARFNAGISSAGGTFSALTRFSAGISAAGGTFSGTQTFVNGATFQGNINAPNIVTSFNGSTGAIVGVNSVRGLTGAVGITNGSGIGLSVSGQTMTFSNTGVLSFNGLTGDVTGVTTGSANTFGPLQSFTNGISAAGGTFSSQARFLSGITVAGGATFATDISVNSIRVGKGAGNQSDNVALGNNSLTTNTTGNFNLAIGSASLESNLDGTDNIALGYASLNLNSSGINNVGVGSSTLFSNTTGSSNTAIGTLSLGNISTGTDNVGIGFRSLGTLGLGRSQNTAIGSQAGYYRGSANLSLLSATGGIYIGYQSRASANAQTNEIVIGTQAVGLGSNTAVIGATTQTAATIYGLLNATSGISAPGGTFSALTRFTAGISAAGGTFSGTQTFVNGATFSSGINITGNVTASGALIGYQQINAQTGTAYTAVLSDVSKLITLNNASGITMTIPLNSSVAFPTGTVLYFAQLGAGQVGFTGASGVTLNFTPGRFLRTQYSTASAIQLSTNLWLLSADLTA